MTRRVFASLVMCIAAVLTAPVKSALAAVARRGTYAPERHAHPCAGVEQHCTKGRAAPAATTLT